MCGYDTVRERERERENTDLHLFWTDMKLAEDVTEEVLDFKPRVNAV